MKIIFLLILILILFLIVTLIKNNGLNFENFIGLLFVNTDAHVINLDTRPDRYEELEKNFEQFPDVLLKRFSAVHMTDEIIKRDYPNVKISKGQLGCGLSHMALLEMAKINNLNTILIIEDDCKPTEHFATWFPVKKWLDANRDKWDVYIGGTCFYNYHPDSLHNLKAVCTVNETIKLYYTSLMCTQFVYVNNSGYDALLNWKTDDVSIAYDNWPDKMNIRAITSTPFITHQAVSYSDLSDSVSDSKSTFVKSEEVINKLNNNESCY